MNNIPAGYCQCGCGQKTLLAPVNDKAKGWVKGQPKQYLNGHNLRQAVQAKSVKSIGNKSISSQGYVRVNMGDRERQYEHILIAEQVLGRPLKAGEVVHHINGDKKDNRHKNLLICMDQYHVELHARLEQSSDWPQFSCRVKHPNGCRRTSNTGFKGVERTRGGRFNVRIKVDGKWINLGVFDTPEQAARAYDAGALKYRGENWATNQSMGLLK